MLLVPSVGAEDTAQGLQTAGAGSEARALGGWAGGKGSERRSCADGRAGRCGWLTAVAW